MEGELTLEKIQKVYEKIKKYIKRTPIDYSYNISELVGCNLYFKLEILQRSKSFKFRGILSKILTLPKGSKIACISGGHHYQSYALAAKLCRINCIIYIPEASLEEKITDQRFGNDVYKYGKTLEDLEGKYQEDLKKESNLILLPYFDDLRIMAGDGAIGIEI